MLNVLTYKLINTSSCCLRVPDDSEPDKAIKNSTFRVHCNSIHGEPAALTNFQSAGLGEAIGLPISMVLQVYLEQNLIRILRKITNIQCLDEPYLMLVLHICKAILSHVICCLTVTVLFPMIRSIEVSSFLNLLFMDVT